MSNRAFVNPKFPFIFHGGDYNPDQWFRYPGTTDEDFRLFSEAGINSISVGIFAWSALEPEEGRFEFGWLDDIMERAAKAGIGVILATPSGAKPNWMAAKYPEVRRMHRPDGGSFAPQRENQCRRHNHCPTSPVYREKCVLINTKLASRYAGHPALAMWHVSNEYGPGCECPLCNAAFVEWLKKRYGTLDALNEAWWTGFWSHRFTDWSQIGSVDTSIDGMVLDRRRFDSDQLLDFFACESKPLREITPDVPVTTNMMGEPFFYLDYWKWSSLVDIASWDAYPAYSAGYEDFSCEAANVSFNHDLFRSLSHGKPFFMMESCPGPTNWRPYPRVVRPGIHMMKSMQAVAHGSDSVCYFQLRKGRGGQEKFHGAVIDHIGSGDNRMFREVAGVGKALRELRQITGSRVNAEVAILFDWESWWALEASCGPTKFVKNYPAGMQEHYRALWAAGIAVDVVNQESDLSGYKVLIAPRMYMVRKGIAEKIEQFVRNGGEFVATYLSGIVNESNLVFTGGLPGPLRSVLGILVEETDYLFPDESNTISADAAYGFGGVYTVGDVCDIVRTESADVVAAYGGDFYAGTPAVTCNSAGKGKAWYIAAALRGDAFASAFYRAMADRLKLKTAAPFSKISGNLRACAREGDGHRYVFIINYGDKPESMSLCGSRTEMLSGREVSGDVEVAPHAVLVFDEQA